jgi:hypothetical protein
MLNCMNIGILLVYAFILFKVLKKEQKMEMFILTGVAFFLLNNTEGFTDSDVASDLAQDGSDTTGSSNSGSDSVAQDLVNPGNINSNNVSDDGGKVESNPLVSAMNMGPYDGICLKTGNKEYWMKSPDNTSLVPNDTLYSYLGSQGPVKMRLSDQSALIGPPVDGVKGSDEKMFMFANNKTSLACCPSTFSTSTGCVCTTENQRDFIAGRGVLPAYENSNESNAEF